MTQSNYQKVQQFHSTFNISMSSSPTPLTKEQLLNRLVFLTEEIIESLQTVCSNETEFQDAYTELLDRMDLSFVKQCDKPYLQNKLEVLIAQADSFVDIDYFNVGNFTLINVDPLPLFDIVHQANMNKLWSDGEPHYNEHGKIVKPEGWHPPEPLLEKEIQRQIQAAL